MYRYGLIVMICVLLFFVVSCEKDPVKLQGEKRPAAPTIIFFELELPAWLTALDDSLAQYAVLILKNLNYVNNLEPYVNHLEENFGANDEPENIYKQPWIWEYTGPNDYSCLYQFLEKDYSFYWDFYYYTFLYRTRISLLSAIKLKDESEQTTITIQREDADEIANSLLWSWSFHEGEFYSLDYYRQMNTLEPRYWFGNLVADDCRIYDGSILKVTITMEKVNEMLIVISTYNYEEEDAKWRTKNRFILNNFKKIGEWFCYENGEITTQGIWHE